MSSPAYIDAREDLDLTGYPLTVYLYLYHGTKRHEFRDALDSATYRPIKQLALASQLACSLSTIERALALLVRRGYLARGPVSVGDVRTYRLVHSRMP